MKIRIVSDAVNEPLTVAQVRPHLRIEPYGSPLEHPDDPDIARMITASRKWMEDYLERSLGTKTYELALDVFKDYIQLGNAPIQSIISVSYVDPDGNTQTLDSSLYYYDEFDYRIYLKTGEQFPITDTVVNAIRVQYIAGYTNGESPDTYPIPYPMLSAMLLMIGSFYENRQQDVMGSARLSFNSVPFGVRELIQPYRLGIGA